MGQVPVHMDGVDLEVRSLIDMLEEKKWLPEEVRFIEHQIYDRKAMIEAGVHHAFRGPGSWNARLQEIDPCLRLRWDFETRSWAIDRWVAEWRCWALLLSWLDEEGQAKRLSWDIITCLQEGDMQRYHKAADYLEEKRRKAGRVRASHEARHNERVMDAVDHLSEARRRQFLEVERARVTRDRIIHHGADLRFVETVLKNQRRQNSH